MFKYAKDPMQEIYDSMNTEVNDYIHGKKNWRGENHVRTLMIMTIERTCGIHQKGVAVGHIDYTQYKKEMKRRKKYWDRVRSGETTDTRRGFDKERGTCV